MMAHNPKKEQRTAQYFLIAEKIKKVCNLYGYAAALHGSLVNDLDLIAIPWTREAIEPKILAAHVFKEIKPWINKIDKEPTLMPHGRLCWTVLLDWHAYIDFCVMPLKSDLKIQNTNRLHEICS